MDEGRALRTARVSSCSNDDICSSRVEYDEARLTDAPPPSKPGRTVLILALCLAIDCEV